MEFMLYLLKVKDSTVNILNTLPTQCHTVFFVINTMTPFLLISILYIYIQINRYLNFLSGMTYFILFTVTHPVFITCVWITFQMYTMSLLTCVYKGTPSGSQKHLLEEGRVGRNLALYLCTKKQALFNWFVKNWDEWSPSFWRGILRSWLPACGFLHTEQWSYLRHLQIWGLISTREEDALQVSDCVYGLKKGSRVCGQAERAGVTGAADQVLWISPL